MARAASQMDAPGNEEIAGGFVGFCSWAYEHLLEGCSPNAAFTLVPVRSWKGLGGTSWREGAALDASAGNDQQDGGRGTAAVTCADKVGQRSKMRACVASCAIGRGLWLGRASLTPRPIPAFVDRTLLRTNTACRSTAGFCICNGQAEPSSLLRADFLFWKKLLRVSRLTHFRGVAVSDQRALRSFTATLASFLSHFGVGCLPAVRIA